MEPLLLVIPGCPSSDTAMDLFDKALRLEGIKDVVEVREITTRDQAEQHGFHGSPSFSLDGTELFASAAAPAVACRVYPTTTGIAGQPGIDDLRRAIRAVLPASASNPGA